MRIKNSVKNILISTIMCIVVIIAGFVSQKVFIDSLGLKYLGINGLFTTIISMLGIAELGLGSAIIYHLYKPMANHDQPLIKSLMNFYKKGYRIIALIVAAIGLLIMPFLGAIVGRVNISENIYIIYILFLLDTVCSYLLAYKRSILYADQKNYVVNGVHTGYVVGMNGLRIALLLITRSYYLYLIIKIITRIIENLIINIIIVKRYPFLNSGKVLPIEPMIKNDIIKKTKALFIHKIAAFVVLGSDNIVISMFLGIKTVGLYSNYYLVIDAMMYIISQAFISITASVGNLLITDDYNKSFEIYKKIRFANFWLVSVTSIGFFVSINPFIMIWLGNKYVVSIGVILALGINLYLQLARSVTNSFKEAAGIFHEDRFVPIAESIVNIVFSILLLQYFGLAGVFMGTICSNLVIHLFSYPKYVYTKLFKRRYQDYYVEFVKYLVLVTVAGLITYITSRAITINNVLINFIINVGLSTIIPSIIYYFIYHKSREFVYFKNLIKTIFTKITDGRKWNTIK